MKKYNDHIVSGDYSEYVVCWGEGEYKRTFLSCEEAVVFYNSLREGKCPVKLLARRRVTFDKEMMRDNLNHT